MPLCPNRPGLSWIVTAMIGAVILVRPAGSAPARPSAPALSSPAPQLPTGVRSRRVVINGPVTVGVTRWYHWASPGEVFGVPGDIHPRMFHAWSGEEVVTWQGSDVVSINGKAVGVHGPRADLVKRHAATVHTLFLEGDEVKPDLVNALAALPTPRLLIVMRNAKPVSLERLSGLGARLHGLVLQLESSWGHLDLVARISRFGQLRRLDVGGSREAFVDAAASQLSGMKPLEELNLFDTAIGDAGLKVLAGLPRLRVLDLRKTRVTDAGLAHLAGLTQLEELRLSDTQVSDAGMVHLARLRSLKHLALRGTRVGDAGLRSLRSVTTLVSLDLRATRVTDAGLVDLGALTRLRELDLGGTRVGDPGLGHLKRLTGLEVLLLTETAVGSPGLQHLAGMVRMRVLGLGATRTGDAGLAHLKAMAELREMDLGATEVTDAGLAHLVPLARLAVLVLGFTTVGDAGMVHVARLGHLTELDLDSTRVGDPGLQRLGALARIVELDVVGSATTAAAAEAFEKQHPGCSLRATPARSPRAILGVKRCDEYLAVERCYQEVSHGGASGPAEDRVRERITRLRRAMRATPNRLGLARIGRYCKALINGFRKDGGDLAQVRHCY
jgi:hypothetical protein